MEYPPSSNHNAADKVDQPMKPKTKADLCLFRSHSQSSKTKAGRGLLKGISPFEMESQRLLLPSRSRLPVPVGQRHHDVKRRQEQHEMEEGVGVGDAVPLVVQHSAGSASLLSVHLGPVLNQRRLVAAQSQFVHLGVCGVADAKREKGAGQRQSWLPFRTAMRQLSHLDCCHEGMLTWSRGHT